MDWPIDISGYSKPIAIGDGYFVCGCEDCGAAVFIDERHYEGDRRDIHTKWHEHEGDRMSGTIRERLDLGGRY